MTHVGLIYVETIFLDEYFATKKCGRVDLRIISPHTMPDSMQERAPRTLFQEITSLRRPVLDSQPVVR